jgi:hypothetical protein
MVSSDIPVYPACCRVALTIHAMARIAPAHAARKSPRGLPRVVQGVTVSAAGACPHLYTRAGRCRGRVGEAHSGGGPRGTAPDPPHWARQLCELRGPEFALRPSAFSPSDSKPTGEVIAGNSKVRLCPIHTTQGANLNQPAHWRLTDSTMSGARLAAIDLPTQCPHKVSSYLLIFARSI